MVDLRKLVASAITGSNLADNINEETPLDRIAALACSDRLGATLWRLKWANDAKAYAPALALLAQRSKRRDDDLPLVRKLCEACLREWLNDLCGKCGGRGHMVIVGTPMAKGACTECGSTGRRRASDASRAKALGIPVKAYPKWEVKFALVHRIIAEADQQAWSDIAAKLGRIPAHRRLSKVVALHGRPRAIMGM